MANEQNLRPIPINTRSIEEQKKIQSKGGKAKTPKKKYAARLRELKKKGLTNETIKRLTDMMEDPECNILDIKLFLDGLRAKNPNMIESIRLANSYINLHKAHHGERHKFEGLNPTTLIQINVVRGDDGNKDNKLEADKKAGKSS